jgi:UDP-N-acetyl-D-mannosaminuronate dehydrogenase
MVEKVEITIVAGQIEQMGRHLDTKNDVLNAGGDMYIIACPERANGWHSLNPRQPGPVT